MDQKASKHFPSPLAVNRIFIPVFRQTRRVSMAIRNAVRDDNSGYAVLSHRPIMFPTSVTMRGDMTPWPEPTSK